LSAALVSAAVLTTPDDAHAAGPAVLASADAGEGPGRVNAQPNIVMIMMDDLDDSVWQNALDRGLLPNIQANLIDHGTTFDNMYAAESLCCPSRTTFLTGQYPHHHGIIRNTGSQGGFQSFNADGSTVATWLHAAGYRTGLLGKYLNGYGTSSKDNHGAYVPPGWDTWWGLPKQVQYNYWASVNGVSQNYGRAAADYQTDMLSTQAKAFLSVADPRPFFLTLTPTAPHYETNDDEGGDGTIRPPNRYLNTPVLPTIPPEALDSYNEADMGDKPVWMQSLPFVDPAGQRTGYNDKVAAIRAVDDMVGMVVTKLQSQGRLANTIIILTSDNGYEYGTHRKVGKVDLYEESDRVPMVILGPGQTVPRHVASWVMNIDWAPTIVDAAGAKPDIVMDGISLLPWLTGDTGKDRLAMLVEYPRSNFFTPEHPPYRMLRTRDPAITGDPTGTKVFIYAQTLNQAMQVTDVEFYDLSIDPLQLQSMQDSPDPQRQQQMVMMSAQVQQLQNCKGAACRVY
jgi:arylsulfatase A-like enzyme